ncbi:hypothetical protein ACGFMK_22285 [Amycolatopsis sp. NPDC049252]|uniref:hypothetical protein n=1 Tax=Amycolatopsis sp. NPDC049252 TaxID=3363933 RepID=UPI0037209898
MGRHWVPLALLGFAELVLVTVELFERSAVAAELSEHLPAAGRYYEGLFGFRIEGSGRTQFLSAADMARAYSGGTGPAWQILLMAAFLAVVGWYAVTRRLSAKPAVAIAAGVLVGVPLADLMLFSEFDWDAATRGPLLVTLGLALVAWYERSPLVLVVALVAGVVAVAIADLPGALISATLLVAGAFAAILPGWGVREGPGSRWRRWGSPS